MLLDELLEVEQEVLLRHNVAMDRVKHLSSRNVKCFLKGGQGACPLMLKDFQNNINFSIRNVGCSLNRGFRGLAP